MAWVQLPVELLWLLGKCNFSFVSSRGQTVIIFLPFFFLALFVEDFWQVFPRLREVVMAFIYIFWVIKGKCSQVKVQYWHSYIYKYKWALNNLGVQFLLEQLVSGAAVQWEM